MGNLGIRSCNTCTNHCQALINDDDEEFRRAEWHVLQHARDSPWGLSLSDQWDQKQQSGTPLLKDPAAAARSSNSQFQDLPMVDPDEVPDALITVQLQKVDSAQKIGMRSATCKGSHRILSIPKDSLLDRWNEKNHLNKVLPGDHVVEVNGTRCDEVLMRKQWLTQCDLCMICIAAEMTAFNIDKNSNQLLGVKTRAGKKVHQVTGIITGGVIDLFNCDKDPAVHAKTLRVGDYIVGVNGMVGDSLIIRQEWISSRKVALLVMSPRHRADVDGKGFAGSAVEGLDKGEEELG